MTKNKFSSYFIFVSFFTLVTVFVSTVQKSYFSLIKPQKIVENNSLLKEINPNIDSSIVSTIESKNKNTDDAFDFSILNKPTIIPIIEPTTIPIVTPTVGNPVNPLTTDTP